MGVPRPSLSEISKLASKIFRRGHDSAFLGNRVPSEVKVNAQTAALYFAKFIWWSLRLSGVTSDVLYVKLFTCEVRRWSREIRSRTFSNEQEVVLDSLFRFLSVVEEVVYGESCAMFPDGWHEPPCYFGSRQRDSCLVDDCPSPNTDMTG